MFRKNWCFLCFISLSVSLLFCANTTNALDPGLAAYWPLDGDAEDATGNGNDGVIAGATEWVEGVQGQALQFDGSSGTVDCGQGETLSPSPMSCMFWMKPSKDLGPGDPRSDIVYYAKGPMFSFNKLPGAGEPLGAPNTIRCWLLGEVARGTLFTKNDEWKEGVWYHIAVTYDEKDVVLYEDGVETGRIEAGGKIVARVNTFLIGRKFLGAVDEVKLYDKALTAKDVVQFGGLAVEPRGKLASAWGGIKRGLQD